MENGSRARLSLTHSPSSIFHPPLQFHFRISAVPANIAAMLACLLLVIALPLAAQEATAPQSLTPFQMAKARALLRSQLPCLGCHELDGDGGRIAPSLTTVAQRRSAGYIRAMVEDPQRVVPGAAMPRTEMPRATRDVITRYLARAARAGDPPAPAPARDARQSVSPQVLYAKWCASCHGERGLGDGPDARRQPVAPAVHASAAAMSQRSDDALFDVIAGGGLVAGKSARMPAFGATLSPSEIRALVGYIRTLFNCEGPAWSRDGSNR
jgi:mono/diheme cytochrome c family protein